MKEIIRLLDRNLMYVSHSIEDDTVKIKAISTRASASCPYCGKESKKLHSHYERKLRDLPIAGKKTQIILSNRKMYCRNKDCSHKTFSETFEFYEPNATMTKRLQKEILKVAMTQSSLSATKYLRGSVADVGKSTICTMLKKGRSRC
jgi:transposase